MDTKLQLADYAHQLDKEIIDLRKQADVLVWELAKRLKEIRDKDLWKTLGEESFFSYLARPELSFDRTTTLKWIQIYEVFIEKYALDPIELNEIGWTKLAKIVPHVKDDDYKFWIDKAESESRSDLDKDLVEFGFITKKEPESKFVEVVCDKCGNHFVWNLKKRADQEFPREDYKKVIDAYILVKEVTPQGNEYRPIQQAIKTLFMNGRTPDQIISSIEWLKNNAEYSWTMQTLANGKIAEILQESGYRPKKEMSEMDKQLMRKAGVEV